MTNRLALILAILVIICILLDVFLNDSEALIFLGRKGLLLIDQIAFWR